MQVTIAALKKTVAARKQDNKLNDALTAAPKK